MITSLLQVMHQKSKCLEDLKKLVINPTTNWEIPVGALRAGSEKVRRSADAVFVRTHRLRLTVPVCECPHSH